MYWWNSKRLISIAFVSGNPKILFINLKEENYQVMSVYRESFVLCRETVCFELKEWVSWQNCKSWQVWIVKSNVGDLFFIFWFTDPPTLFLRNRKKKIFFKKIFLFLLRYKKSLQKSFKNCLTPSSLILSIDIPKTFFIQKRSGVALQ